MKSKNYFGFGFILTVILSFLIIGSIMVFGNMQKNLVDYDYKMFEMYRNSEDSFCVTMLNDKYIVKVEGMDEVENIFAKSKKFLPQMACYIIDGVEWIEEEIYKLLDQYFVSESAK